MSADRSGIRRWVSILAPLVTIAAIAMIPAPPGLAQHAWYFFAIFAGVVAGLMFEPLPGGAIGFLGVTLVTVLASHVLYSPQELAAPGFNAANAALLWALSGFSNSTVWLIFGAFMFALGYEKTGLGRRIALVLVKRMGHRTLTLGYAVTFADVILAPFTPSNTARSGGTIYPVIRNLPALYDSKPNDPSARKIGSYIMWVAISATCVNSSLFMTAMAPNLLSVELVRKTMHVEIGWTQWFLAFAPVGIPLLLLLPLLAYWIYPPEIKAGVEVPAWAARELDKMGGLTGNEVILAVLVLIALLLWIFAGNYINPTTVALMVISLMLLAGVITWKDMMANSSAWNTLAWFATLVALADGLGRVGFVSWFADAIAIRMRGLSSTVAVIALLVIFFLSHYLFASVAAHVTAMLPLILAAGTTIPGVPVQKLALLLCVSAGIMGILTPYGSGPSPVYYGSGYLPSADYWRLGAIFGLIFLGMFLLIGVPIVLR